jgi:hypothetical protein
MNEIFQIVETLIKDGISWQETVTISTISITFGFIIWSIVTGTVSLLKCVTSTIDHIIVSIINKFIETTSSLLKTPSSNQPPNV